MSTAPTQLSEASQAMISDVSVAKGFALMLETACSDFEALQRIIRQETLLIFASGGIDYRGQAQTRMALAKSFVFHVVRARRICEHSAAHLNISRDQRRSFISDTAGVLSVRDVNEHGFDIGGTMRKKLSRPSRHHHLLEDAIVDETSMVVLGDQKILMGPLNLYDMYIHTDTIRKVAGIISLRSQEGK